MFNARKLGSLLTGAVVAIAAVTGGAACTRGDENAGATVEKKEASGVQQVNQPTKVVGCLRAGAGTNTYVLTTERTETGAAPATYELIGSGGANLSELTGQPVEVSGILETQQRIASRTTTDPAPNVDEPKPGATGTAGTPSVATSTKLDIKRIEVQRVQPLGGECRN